VVVGAVDNVKQLTATEVTVCHTVKILGFSQKKWYKGFYAKNVVPYICEDDI
jgi:hypothetical protein